MVTANDMPLIAQITANSIAGAKLGAEGYQAQKERDAKLAQLIKGKEMDDDSFGMKRDRDLDDSAAIRKLLGKDAAVRVGDVSGDPRSYDAARYNSGVADKEADNDRLETAALQAEYNRLAGKLNEQLGMGTEIDNMLKNDTNITSSALTTKLPRFHGEVGALAEQEQKRALPTNLVGDVKKGWNYMTGGTESPLSSEQKEAVSGYVAVNRKALEGRKQSALDELNTRASTLAPSLHKRGKLPGVMAGFGTRSGPPSTSPPPGSNPPGTGLGTVSTEDLQKMLEKIQSGQ